MYDDHIYIYEIYIYTVIDNYIAQIDFVSPVIQQTFLEQLVYARHYVKG